MNSNYNIAKFFKLPKIINRFGSDRKGATAIEFAMVAGPFFLLIFSILETSIYFFASQYLENTIDDVTRKIRTGQLQQIQTADDFKDVVCGEIVALFDCESGMIFKVKVLASFGEDDGGPPNADDFTNIGGDPNDEPSTYDPAGPSEILQVNAYYLWPIYTNYAAPLTTDGVSGKALITATTIVRTEPFTPAGS